MKDPRPHTLAGRCRQLRELVRIAQAPALAAAARSALAAAEAELASNRPLHQDNPARHEPR